MAETNDVFLSKMVKLIEQLTAKHSVKSTETFFGITIKKVGEDDVYNVYKNGKLIFAKLERSTVINILGFVTHRLVNRMCDEAEQEDDLKKTDRKFRELEKMEIENEKQNYYTCPICHSLVRKGSHFHVNKY